MEEHDKTQREEDFQDARRKYLRFLETGEEGLELLLEVFKESEHPRAAEVFATMLKNLAEINEKVLDLHKKNKDITTEVRPTNQIEGPDKVTNVFVGTAVDLQRLITEQQDDTIDITPNDTNNI